MQCETSDLLVPADAEVVVEGEVLPYERTEEGPHGESTGFYGQNKAAFVIKVKAITHRKDPLTYGLICQRVEDYPRQLLRSGSMQSRLVQRTGKTNIREVYFPEVGRHGMLIVSADIQSREEPREIMEAIWDAEAWRWIIVVDDDCNVRDWEEVMWRVVSAADVDDDVFPGRVFPAHAAGAWGGRLHSTEPGHGHRRDDEVQGGELPAGEQGEPPHHGRRRGPAGTSSACRSPEPFRRKLVEPGALASVGYTDCG